MITLVTTNSETISRAWYLKHINVLAIEFKCGAKYKYQDVAEDKFFDFVAAPSKGTFFNNFIKNEHKGAKFAPRS